MARWAPLGTPGRLAAIVVILVAPWMMAFLADGITPLSTGTTTLQWLSWQVTLAVVGVGLGLVAGKLWGRSTLPAWWVPVAGAVAAIGLALYGVATWQPFEGWPSWYPFLWLPVAFLAVQGVTRFRVVVSATVVAGAAAAVLTWSTEVEARMLVAQRDADRLSEGDPIAISMVQRFGDSLSARAVPRVSAAPLAGALLRSSLRRYPLRPRGARDSRLGHVPRALRSTRPCRWNTVFTTWRRFRFRTVRSLPWRLVHDRDSSLRFSSPGSYAANGGSTLPTS